MKYALIIATIMLTGCSTVMPVAPKFPDAPEALRKQCPELKTLQDKTVLSEVAKTVTANYTLYHECSLKNDAWNEWYDKQKSIFEGVK